MSRRKAKEQTTTKETVRKMTVIGYEDFRNTIKELYIGEKPPQLNILFSGEKNHLGVSWCPDCNVAEPFIQRALIEYAKRDSIFIEVDVGDRDTYKDRENPFRLDKDVRIQEIPTLLRWNTPIRLDGDQCAKSSLLEMFFVEPEDED